MVIVVMGGSFNPPTIAHLKIMQTALDAVNGETGFFVPVSCPYLKRKMAKAGQSHLCLSDNLRIRMLEAMSASDSRIRIFTEAMDSPFSDDAGLMKLIQDRYPDASLYYAAGADKLDLLDHFAMKSDFLNCFRCILYARDSSRLSEEIAAHEHLAECQDAFILVNPPEEIEGISSTRIRGYLFDIGPVAEMLHPEVIPLLRGLRKEDFPEEILQFKDGYRFLSNDFPAEVTYEGITYPCASLAFLASKTDDMAERKSISRMNPVKARQKHSADPGSPEWKTNRKAIMKEIVRSKFLQNPSLMEQLAATGRRKLINGGKKDTFWGISLITWEGENHLGQILMKVREEGFEG